jgi:gluconate 2-dehydrogenase gamma chain
MRVEPHALVKTRRFLVVHLPAWVGLLLGLRSISASALEPPAQANAGTPTVFTADERAFVAAAIDRLLPADDHGPGGIAAEVPRYIDVQLAGPWGRGDNRYVAGAVRSGPVTLGNQSVTSRAVFYRESIAALRHLPAGAGFTNADASARDAFLRSLQQGEHDTKQLQGSMFFAALLEDALAGFMSDPSYGGNAGFIGWKLIGYPGVRYDWTPYLRNDGKPLAMETVGIYGPADGYGLN